MRAFLAVAEELHFGRAAERLGIAQPPLSRAIRQFEQELGTELFHRTTRQVALAPAGEALLAPARALLAAADTAQQSVQMASAGDIGRVRLGLGTLSSHRVASRLVAEAHRRKPGITVDLESNVYSEEGIARLHDGTLDLALIRWQTQPPGIAGRPALFERPMVAVHAEHRLAGRSSVTVEDLRDESFILLPTDPGSTIRDLTLHWCYEAGFSPRIVQEAPDSQLVSALVAAGMGITVTYDSVMAHLHDPNLVAVPLSIAHDPIVVYLAHREGELAPALREVLAAAEAAVPTPIPPPHTVPRKVDAQHTASQKADSRDAIPVSHQPSASSTPL